LLFGHLNFNSLFMRYFDKLSMTKKRCFDKLSMTNGNTSTGSG
jgi:hypothetical protein